MSADPVNADRPGWDDAADLAEVWGCVEINPCWPECVEAAAHELGVSP